MNKIIAALLLIAACTVVPAFGQTGTEQQKIDYLLHSVASLQNATFIRNGNEYSPQRAADHLRLKLRLAGDRVKTAEDFIVYCATASSMSGEKYRIKFQDGHVVEAAAYLHDRLNNYAADNQPAPES